MRASSYYFDSNLGRFTAPSISPKDMHSRNRPYEKAASIGLPATYRRWLAWIVLVIPLPSVAMDFAQDFAVVFATAATESRYGRMPLDRSLLAQAIENAQRAGARGVIVKFFLDQPRTTEGDRRLAEVISKTEVILQARLDDSEQAPNSLADRFTVPETGLVTAISGGSGWIPAPQFAQHARNVCFVDFDSSPVPILETYRGKAVKSLLLCAAEFAVGRQAVVQTAQSVLIGAGRAELDAFNRVTVDLRNEKPLPTLEFNRLIDGTIPILALKDKIVVLAYDGPNIHKVKSPIGTMGAHRLFVLMLRAFYENLASDVRSIAPEKTAQ